VILYDAFSLGYGPIDVVWSLLLFAVGGAAGLPALVVWCLLLGGLTCVVSMIRSQGLFGDDDPSEVKPGIRGPITYAGPGSLGGTESAIRR
jgi:hypothetical protein